jgi:hypothetical protein
VGNRFEAETEPMGAHQALSMAVKSSGGKSASAGRRGGQGAHWLGRRSSRGRPSARSRRDGAGLGRRLAIIGEADLRQLDAVVLAHHAR